MKKAFYIGVVFGALLGIAVALTMDIFLGKSLGGGWTEAVAYDLNRLFDADLSQNHLIVIAGVAVVIGIIGAFGALIGGICFALIANFFKMLTKES